MFKFLKEAYGPSIFTKSLLRYKQGKFEESIKLILKAGRWMPALETDDFYRATLLSVESKLGAPTDIKKFKAALESLVDSPYRNKVGYSIIVADLQEILREPT